MPWTTDDPPSVAENWTESEIEACVSAANAVLEEGGEDEEAIFACIHAAGKSDDAEEDEDKVSGGDAVEKAKPAPAAKKVRGHERKTFPSYLIKFDEDLGIVEHIVTVFGIVDYGADMSHPGCFTKTLVERGMKVRVLDSHNDRSIFAVLGKPLEMREVGRNELPKEVLDDWPEATGGLWARTQFLMDTPEGKGAFIRLKEGAVTEWSYAYDALDTDYKEIEWRGEKIRVRNLRTLRLWEYSPVLWGMNPATATISAKGQESGPTEGKLVETTDEYVRVRMRDPGDFQEDTFATIDIDEDNGIRAIVGRLEGEDTTTIQAYLFDVDEWSEDEAVEWVDEHEEDKVLASALRAMKSANLTRIVNNVCRQFYATFPDTSEGMYWVREVYEDGLTVDYESWGNPTQTYWVDYAPDGDGVTFAPQEEWARGSYEFVEMTTASTVDEFSVPVVITASIQQSVEAKVGRVLSSANEARIVAAMESLISVLESAGIDIPGVDTSEMDADVDETEEAAAQIEPEEKEAEPVIDTPTEDIEGGEEPEEAKDTPAPVEQVAVEDTSDDEPKGVEEAGPPEEAPTEGIGDEEKLLLELEAERLGIEIILEE